MVSRRVVLCFFFASSQRQVVIAAAFRLECAAPVPTVHQHLSPGPVPILHQLLWTSADLLLSWGPYIQQSHSR